MSFRLLVRNLLRTWQWRCPMMALENLENVYVQQSSFSLNGNMLELARIRLNDGWCGCGVVAGVWRGSTFGMFKFRVSDQLIWPKDWWWPSRMMYLYTHTFWHENYAKCHCFSSNNTPHRESGCSGTAQTHNGRLSDDGHRYRQTPVASCLANWRLHQYGMFTHAPLVNSIIHHLLTKTTLWLSFSKKGKDQTGRWIDGRIVNKATQTKQTWMDGSATFIRPKQQSIAYHHHLNWQL